MTQTKLTSLIQKIEQNLQEVRTQFLINMAEDVVNSSKPTVDTGAYITSHSIRTTRGAGRSRTSHGKPTGQSADEKAAESLSQLMEDIASLPSDQEQVFLSNNAPHATQVEYKHGYAVYEGVRNRAKNHLEDAINTVKGRR